MAQLAHNGINMGSNDSFEKGKCYQKANVHQKWKLAVHQFRKIAVHQNW